MDIFPWIGAGIPEYHYFTALTIGLFIGLFVSTLIYFYLLRRVLVAERTNVSLLENSFSQTYYQRSAMMCAENLKQSARLRTVIKNIVNSQCVLVDNHNYGSILHSPLRHNLQELRAIADDLNQYRSHDWTNLHYHEAQEYLPNSATSDAAANESSNDKTHHKIVTMLNKAIMVMKPLCKENNVVFSYSIDTLSESLSVSGAWLHRALLELMINAIKCNENGTTLHLSAVVDSQSVRIQVRDNGKGIPHNISDAICANNGQVQAFRRSYDQTLHTNLFAVQAHVNAVGGHFSIKSARNYCTEVNINLPLAVLTERKNTARLKAVNKREHINESRPSISECHEVRYENRCAKNKLLLIENTRGMLSPCVQKLKVHYQVKTVNSLSDGIALIHKIKPNAILIDCDSDFSRGLSLQNYLSSSSSLEQTPVILLGQNEPNITQVCALKAGISAVLEKPISPDALCIAVEQVLEEKNKMVTRVETMLANYHASLFDNPDNIASKEESFVSGFNDILAKHYTEEEFTRVRAAKLMNMSDKTIARRINTCFDRKFTDLLKVYRLERAKELLLKGVQITAASYEVGFSSPSYFTQCFKAEYGFLPSLLAKKESA